MNLPSNVLNLIKQIFKFLSSKKSSISFSKAFSELNELIIISLILLLEILPNIFDSILFIFFISSKLFVKVYIIFLKFVIDSINFLKLRCSPLL